MDIILIVLRLIHIVAAVTWFGMGFTLLLFIAPAEKASGEAGLRFIKAMFTTTRVGITFPVVSGLTTLAGILLYLTGSTNHFSTPGNIVLGIGAVAGLLAAGHGGAVTGRYTREYAMALGQHVQDNQPVSAEAISTIESLRVKYHLHIRISVILTAIALIFMAAARYF